MFANESVEDERVLNFSREPPLAAPTVQIARGMSSNHLSVSNLLLWNLGGLMQARYQHRTRGNTETTLRAMLAKYQCMLKISVDESKSWHPRPLSEVVKVSVIRNTYPQILNITLNSCSAKRDCQTRTCLKSSSTLSAIAVGLSSSS